MAATNAATARRLERLGLGLLSPGQGLAALGAVIAGFHSPRLDFDGCRGGGGGLMTVSPFDWPKLVSQQPREALDGVLSEFAAAASASSPTDGFVDTRNVLGGGGVRDNSDRKLPQPEVAAAAAAAAAVVVDVAALEAMVMSEAALILGGEPPDRDAPLMASVGASQGSILTFDNSFTSF
jgi:hypothetical protein